jgi:transposase
VLAELCRRDLVPELWIPSLDDRALRERLRRRTHLVRLRASAMNRIFGLLTQWGLRLTSARAATLKEHRGHGRRVDSRGSPGWEDVGSASSS